LTIAERNFNRHPTSRRACTRASIALLPPAPRGNNDDVRRDKQHLDPTTQQYGVRIRRSNELRKGCGQKINLNLRALRRYNDAWALRVCMASSTSTSEDTLAGNRAA
jgi:hypothetical protein